MLRIRMSLSGLALASIAVLSPSADAQQPARGTYQAGSAVSRNAVFVAAKGTFWEALNDTTLNRLMAEALRGNLDLRAASARVDGAGATRLQASLELAPSMSASAGYSRRRLSSVTIPGFNGAGLPDQGLWDSGLNIAWEPDLFGRLRGNLRAQSSLVGAANEDARDARVTVAANLARAYLDLRGAQNQLAVARRNAENQQRTLDLTKERVAAGRGTDFDTERGRAQLNFTLAAIPSLEARIAQAQYRIAVLVGRPPQALKNELADECDLPELPDSIPSANASEVALKRPDVLSASNRVNAARALVHSARADYLPRLSVVARAGYTASAFDAFGNDGTFNYAVGPVITWPAFDVGRVKARVDEAQAQEVEARARYEQVVLIANEAVESATVRYRSARTRLNYLREAASASERAAELANLRYKGGVADFLVVLDAERTLLAAQDQLAQAQTDASNAYVALFEARGASWNQ